MLNATASAAVAAVWLKVAALGAQHCWVIQGAGVTSAEAQQSGQLVRWSNSQVVAVERHVHDVWIVLKNVLRAIACKDKWDMGGVSFNVHIGTSRQATYRLQNV